MKKFLHHMHLWCYLAIYLFMVLWMKHKLIIPTGDHFLYLPWFRRLNLKCTYCALYAYCASEFYLNVIAWLIFLLDWQRCLIQLLLSLGWLLYVNVIVWLMLSMGWNVIKTVSVRLGSTLTLLFFCLNYSQIEFIILYLSVLLFATSKG